MANLIPPAAKKHVLIEYWLRVTTIWFLLLGLAGLALGLLHVPVYILIQSQLTAIADTYAEAANQNTSFEMISAQISNANYASTLLASGQKVVALVPYVNKIDAAASDNVTINSYALERDGNVVSAIKLSGVAATRESLVAFSRALEAIPEFEQAEIPLSNLAKDSNIPFNLQVALTEVKKP